MITVLEKVHNIVTVERILTHHHGVSVGNDLYVSILFRDFLISIDGNTRWWHRCLQVTYPLDCLLKLSSQILIILGRNSEILCECLINAFEPGDLIFGIDHPVL
jgi:hypothetical protein